MKLSKIGKVICCFFILSILIKGCNTYEYIKRDYQRSHHSCYIEEPELSEKEKARLLMVVLKHDIKRTRKVAKADKMLNKYGIVFK